MARPPLEFELEADGLYVFTFNGFPYGPFHGARVKERGLFAGLAPRGPSPTRTFLAPAG